MGAMATSVAASVDEGSYGRVRKINDEEEEPCMVLGRLSRTGMKTGSAVVVVINIRLPQVSLSLTEMERRDHSSPVITASLTCVSQRCSVERGDSFAKQDARPAMKAV